MVLIMARFAIAASSLLMDELSSALSQFYPSYGMSGSGGAANPPGPAEDPSFPFLTTENHDRISLVLQLLKERVALSGILAMNYRRLKNCAKISTCKVAIAMP